MKVKLIKDHTKEELFLELPIYNEKLKKNIDIDLTKLMEVFGKKHRGYKIEVIEDDTRISLKNSIRKSDSIYDLNRILYIFEKLSDWEMVKLKFIIDNLSNTISLKNINFIIFNLDNLTLHTKYNTLKHVGIYLMLNERPVSDEDLETFNFEDYAKEKLKNSKSIFTKKGFLEYVELD